MIWFIPNPSRLLFNPESAICYNNTSWGKLMLAKKGIIFNMVVLVQDVIPVQIMASHSCYLQVKTTFAAQSYARFLYCKLGVDGALHRWPF